MPPLPIVKTPGVCGGAARIEGTKVPVWLVVLDVSSGRSLEQICMSYGLTREQVEEALRYYEEHREEIEGEMEEA
ncbi:MAG: hypothetical protein DRO06_03915, partial [Thermoproteota archaeon]